MADREPTRVIIIGAAGRDFHDFNVHYRDDDRYRVVAFTAAQIPDIDGRTYPTELAGTLYPDGIPIYAEDRLQDLIREHGVGECSMSYSDLPYAEVMHKASICNAAGADFRILGPRATMIASNKPVISICAVRTGCGKSQTARRINEVLAGLGKKTATIRHPMPYGDLRKQIWQRFAGQADLDLHECTIEEREEYEPHLAAGNIVFAGVDYGKILEEAEKEADVILWDGGNNDLPFYKPDLHIVVADPHRPGHEVAYFPGETNARMADLLLINKVDTANEADIATVEKNLQRINPDAKILRASSPVSVDDPAAVKGKRVLVVEDGPTLTHGEMTYGAGHVAARKYGAGEIVDPRPFAVGSIRSTYEKYSHMTEILPAMGYGEQQMEELKKTIQAVDCDLVLIGTPIDLAGLIEIDKPTLRVRYDLDEATRDALASHVQEAVTRS